VSINRYTEDCVNVGNTPTLGAGAGATPPGASRHARWLQRPLRLDDVWPKASSAAEIGARRAPVLPAEQVDIWWRRTTPPRRECA
jgi:hypothetical protein